MPRLASGLHNQHDPAVAALFAMAVEFEAKAVAMAAEEVAEKLVEEAAQDDDKDRDRS